uniref:3'-5' exonuclease domain-containing protein n=1 Tax=Panagrolaimus sp. ES5 TaxID=591445 RepID=A0AC34G171_9BILA
AKIEELKLGMKDEAYLAEFLIDGKYKICLIDNLEKLQGAMSKLCQADAVAFDVEAGYVCQNVEGLQQAALMQLAFENCVLLIDIKTIVKQVADEHIKTFFEIFLGTDIKRIGFAVKSDLDYLRNTFIWMSEYFQRVQPTFHCVQKFADAVYSTQAFADFFPPLDGTSLKEVVFKWLNEDVDKAERQGNWFKRPLSKDKIIYAAKDVKFHWDAFYYVQRKLTERNLSDAMNSLIITPKMVDKKKSRSKKDEKEPIDEIIQNVEIKIKEMREKLHNFEKPQNVTIVVDFAFIPIVPHLRRFGYKTFDQRDLDGGEHFSPDQRVKALSAFMKNRISDGTITHCYLLTDSHSNVRFTTEVKIDELKIINSDLDETESSIICNIMYDTNTIVNTTEFFNRCTKCGQSQAAVDFPADIFRVIYLHYAKNKGFFCKLKCDDNSDEVLKQLINEKTVKLHDKKMTFHINNICSVTFDLGDKLICERQYENQIDEKKYKCNTKIFENLGDNLFFVFVFNVSNFFEFLKFCANVRCL